MKADGNLEVIELKQHLCTGLSSGSLVTTSWNETNQCILQNTLRKLTWTSLIQHAAEAPSIVCSHLDQPPHFAFSSSPDVISPSSYCFLTEKEKTKHLSSQLKELPWLQFFASFSTKKPPAH